MDLYVVAGEPSADLQGAHIIEALLRKRPFLNIRGVAGPHLRSLGVSGNVRMEELSVMGFSEVVAHLPRLVRLFYTIRRDILHVSPKAVLCIDYPGFNLRLARSLRKGGYRGQLIHGVCPSVWAWAKWRIPLMVKNLDLLLSFLPFEKQIFAHTPLSVEYVGHPLVAHIRQESFARKNLLALFPGSRRGEIIKNFPIQKRVAEHLQALIPGLEVAVSVANEEARKQLEGLTHPFVLVEPQRRYELMRSARLALATSGTVTLELALCSTPTVVHYAIRTVDCFVAQKILRIQLPYYCLVNIILNREGFPEFFGPHCTVDKILNAALGLLHNSERCQEDFRELRSLLGEGDAAETAAERILELVF